MRDAVSRDRAAGSGMQPACHVLIPPHSWSRPPEPSSASAARPDKRVLGTQADRGRRQGPPSGRDATVLGSLLARAMGAELTLIDVHEEPLLPVDLPGAMNWTAIEEQAPGDPERAKHSRAPHARIMVQADVLGPACVAPRGPTRAPRPARRGFGPRRPPRGASSSGETPATCSGTSNVPLRSDRRAPGSTPSGGLNGSASDLHRHPRVTDSA